LAMAKGMQKGFILPCPTIWARLTLLVTS